MENFLTTLAEINDKINAFIWVKIGLVLLIGTGILMTCCTKWFQISHIGHWWQQTIGGVFRRDSGVHVKTDKKTISQFQALCTALAATIGQTGYGTFTGHPKGKRLYLIHAYILMIAYTAFCGAKDCAVLAAIAGKYFCSTVIHFYRNRNFQSTFGNRNNSCCACIKLHCLNRFIQWNLGHFKNIHNQASLLSKRI